MRKDTLIKLALTIDLSALPTEITRATDKLFLESY